MNTVPYDALKTMLEARRWTEALAKVDEMLASNPCAAQLHLLRGQLLQLQNEHTPYTLDDAALALQNALALDDTYFDALVELMHFYDAVCPDMRKAVAYATQVKTIALQALDEARAVLDDHVAHVS